MKNVFYYLVIVTLGITITSHAEMKLRLSSVVKGDAPQSIFSNNLTSNLKLEVPASVSNLSDMEDFAKGLIMVGLLVDATIPFGDDFKHIAGTGFSGHAFASYVVARSILLTLRAGYVKFATQTEEGHEFGYDYKYEDKYSQIPILLGAYYLISTNSGFKPYVGVALGLFLATYSYEWNYSGITETGDDTQSKFGVVPSVGFYYFVAATTMIQVAVEYNLIFQELPESSSSNLSSVSFLAGIAFALDGN